MDLMKGDRRLGDCICKWCIAKSGTITRKFQKRNEIKLRRIETKNQIRKIMKEIEDDK